MISMRFGGVGRRAVVLSAASFAILCGSAQAATFKVTNTANSGAGSLRAAITASNGTPGSNTIDFAIGSGAQTISPTSPLPAITVPVMLDGTTQPGFAGVPLIRLDGAGISGRGLLITAGGSTVKSLEITDWTTGLELRGHNGGNVVEGSYIGTDGSSAHGNGTGVLIDGASLSNVVGAGNVISGNTTAGVLIEGSGTQGNVVERNAIGTNAARSAAVPNSTGVLIGSGATKNTVGGTSAADRNLISGNSAAGVELSGVTNDTVAGNYIGTNAAGTAKLANSTDGVLIGAGSMSDTIGGATAGAGNVISGNGNAGVELSNPNCRATPQNRDPIGGGIPAITSSAILIEGNHIGTNAGGTAAVGNSEGVLAGMCSSAVQIGGTTAGARNVISGNGDGGVRLDQASGDLVEGNYIGTNAGGTAPVHDHIGIWIQAGSSSDTIGGTTAGARNVISGNDLSAMQVDGSGNTIEGNYIGTNASGNAAVSNSQGVIADNGTGNVIGGTTVGARNVISGSAGVGVGLASASGDLVEGNYIGTDATGTAPLGNGTDVSIDGGANGNTIGGTSAAAANTIAHSGSDGVLVYGSTTVGNSILGNSIFANASLGIALTSGGNNNEPAPLITSVETSAGSTTISGKVISGTHRIEVFSNPSCTDPEGKTFLGFTTSSTTTWSLTVPALPAGLGVTATSTDTATHNTSEFSRCLTTH